MRLLSREPWSTTGHSRQGRFQGPQDAGQVRGQGSLALLKLVALSGLARPP